MRASALLKKGQNVSGKMVVKSDEFFAKRKEVMAIIYGLKKTITLPRVEVKISKSTSTCLGMGFFAKPVIMIEESLSGDDLYFVVLHELVHTVFGMKGHNEKCILMSSKIQRGHTRAALLKAFLSYNPVKVAGL